jgi:hypothetical protein
MSEVKYGEKLNTFRYIKKIKGGHKYYFRETKIKF